MNQTLEKCGAVSAPSDICAEDSQDLFRAKFIKWDKILRE